jgi:putative RNA 2'-phosphotransferase
MTDPVLIERITRSLAFMLRHQPETFDLELDPFGFADLEDVVHALNERLGEPVEEDDVREAVGSGDRPRYEIQGELIRALYGHSIHVEPGPSSKPPELLFVAVPERELERARRFGLRGGRRRFLHLALSKDDAAEAGRRASRDYAVLVIHALDAWEEGVSFYDRTALWLAEEVPTHLLDVEGSYHDGSDPAPRRFEGGREREERYDGPREERGGGHGGGYGGGHGEDGHRRGGRRRRGRDRQREHGGRDGARGSGHGPGGHTHGDRGLGHSYTGGHPAEPGSARPREGLYGRPGDERPRPEGGRGGGRPDGHHYEGGRGGGRGGREPAYGPSASAGQPRHEPRHEPRRDDREPRREEREPRELRREPREAAPRGHAGEAGSGFGAGLDGDEPRERRASPPAPAPAPPKAPPPRREPAPPSDGPDFGAGL